VHHDCSKTKSGRDSIPVAGKFSEKDKRETFRGVADGLDRAILCAGIAGMVAAMPESDPGIASERASDNTLG